MNGKWRTAWPGPDLSLHEGRPASLSGGDVPVSPRWCFPEEKGYSCWGAMADRFIASCVMVALFMTAGVPCAGWQASAEARHDCCAKRTCPEMMRSTADHDNISQEAADQCCARSEEKNQQNSSQFATVFFAIAPVITLTNVPQTEVFHVQSPRLDHAPPAPASTPRHVLLSVFLV